MGWAYITNLDAVILDELWYMSTIVEFFTVLVVMHKLFTLNGVISTANSDRLWKESISRNMLFCLFVCLCVCFFVCLFVCLFVYLLICLFVCLFVCVCVCVCVCVLVCLSNTGVTPCTGNCA